MDVALAAWVVIAVALALANLPFLTEKVFGLVALKGAKPLWIRLAELLVLYFVVGAVARLLEGRIGSVFAQDKEFYMLTVPLFVTLAFPGFVIRYLRKRHH